MNKQMISVRGSGGGGKGGGGSSHTPTEAPDTLRSKQYAKVLDLITEGEIEGSVDGLKTIYLDDTPIQNADGSYNFTGVTLATVNGTQSQDVIAGFNTIESEVAVGTQIKHSAPLTHTISDANVDAVRVTLSIPALSLQDLSTGDLGGTSVEIAVDIQNNGGGYIPQPMGNTTMDSNKFATTPSGGYSIAASTIFSITTTWTGDNIHQSQSGTAQLQYRIAGSGSGWSVYTSFTYSGSPTQASANQQSGIAGSGPLGTYYSSPFQPVVYNPASASRTFNVSLASNAYEFRMVLIAGTGSVAIVYGAVGVPTYTDVISGKTTSRYQRSYRFNLSGTGPWDIRVRRVTSDTIAANIQNNTFWDSYTEIIDSKLSYPNCALAALQVDAAQFNAVPKRGYLIKGIKCQIPSNYDPLLLTYTGVWDGTFITKWTCNPAWVFYDLLTNARYGLGEYIGVDQVDKWELYSIAQYCDELVPDGFGGQEPRFTCNIYIQTRAEAYTLIANIASIFRGMTFWNSGMVTAVQDKPSDPIAIFTNANVVNSQFTYSGSSAKTRHTVALVSWNDPQDSYLQKIEYVGDPAGIARYGVLQAELAAIGCTSRGQAHRIGQWLLYSERLETETVTFRTGLDGIYAYPGAVINTQDPVRAGKRFGGRILPGSSISSINIDAPVIIESGKTYTLYCVMPDGSIETHSVSNAPGTFTALALSTSLSTIPQDYAIWLLAANDLVAEIWRVVSAVEVNKTQIEITALAHNPSKYDAIEQNLALETLVTTDILANPGAPISLTVTESLYLSGLSTVGTKAVLSWDSQESRFLVQYRLADGNVNEIEVLSPTVDIAPIAEGIYTFSVIAVNAIGRKSVATQLTQEIYGKTLPPSDITGFAINKSGGVGIIQLDEAVDLDVQVGGNIVIRHSPMVSGAAWTDGYVVEVFPGDAISGIVPLITGTYMAKALDSTGHYSVNMTAFVATEGMVTGFTTVGTSTQAPSFGGALTNMARIGSGIQLDGSVAIDSITDLIDTWGNVDSFGGLVASGLYVFDTYMDLSTVATRRVEADVTTVSFDTGNLIDARMDNIDDWGLVDGDTINDCDVTLYAATTNTDPSASPVWTAWTPFFVGDFTCRAIKFQLTAASGNINHNINCSQLTVHAKIPA